MKVETEQDGTHRGLRPLARPASVLAQPMAIDKPGRRFPKGEGTHRTRGLFGLFATFWKQHGRVHFASLGSVTTGIFGQRPTPVSPNFKRQRLPHGLIETHKTLGPPTFLGLARHLRLRFPSTYTSFFVAQLSR
jgi:hypothetical protein